MLIVEQIANPGIDWSKHRSLGQVHVLGMIIEQG